MAKGKQFTDEDDALLGELGIEAELEKAQTYTPKQERIIAGFEDIQRFVQKHNRPPRHGEDHDIFERLYAVRLDRIRASDECVELLKPLDADGLLERQIDDTADELSDDELLDALGVEAKVEAGDITRHRHVRPQAERKSPDEVAQRKRCADFGEFRARFEQVQRQLQSGERRTVSFKGRDNQKIERGDWYVLDGQKAYVAGADKPFVAEYGERDRRLRVIFDNGTESDLLMRSLRRALNKDDASRRILLPDTDVGPLFSNTVETDDQPVGIIYVLRSLSDHPFIAEHRDVIHKIGVTGGNVKQRIANARKDPTFLLADVEIVATFNLANVNRRSLEVLLHKLFEGARLDLELQDRFGEHVEPREWFLVPLPVIDDAVQRIIDGKIADLHYDPKAGRLSTAQSM